MKFAALFLGLSVALACAQNITVQVGGRPVGSANTLNFESGTGIIQSCHPDGGQRITCTPSYDSAVVTPRDAIHGTENVCTSATHSTSYACRISRGTLLGYSPGMTIVLVVDVPCPNQCSLNVDALGPVSLKRSDGVTDPLGTLIPGEPQWVFYDGQIFRLLGGGGGPRATGQDRDRDALARRFIASMETMAYARTVSLETTAGDVHKTTTSNAIGNATINAVTAGLPGQHMWVIIVNDQISGKTVSFGNNFKSAGPLMGSPGKSATLQFISDGTAWYEVARTGNL
ncbi:MAG: hypothetical protein ABSG13_29745 [Bryobacteraceae bacterium]|jgi:hypothetical protein